MTPNRSSARLPQTAPADAPPSVPEVAAGDANALSEPVAEETADALLAFLPETDVPVSVPVSLSVPAQPIDATPEAGTTDASSSRRAGHDGPFRWGTGASWVVLLCALVALTVGVAVEKRVARRPARPQADSTSIVAKTQVPDAPAPQPAIPAPAMAVPAPAPAPAATAKKAAGASQSKPAASASRAPRQARAAIASPSMTPKAVPVAPAPVTAPAIPPPAEWVVVVEPIEPRPLLPSAPTTPVQTDNGEAIRRVLDAYRDSYDHLDASSAALIWRGVDTRALARAFSSLSSQALSFDQCDVRINGAQATARCSGELRYVRRVGAPTMHVLRLSWAIDLERNADRWVIASIKAN
jgi:hypothetical protein